jgi:hypothetical protein
VLFDPLIRDPELKKNPDLGPGMNIIDQFFLQYHINMFFGLKNYRYCNFLIQDKYPGIRNNGFLNNEAKKAGFVSFQLPYQW